MRMYTEESSREPTYRQYSGLSFAYNYYYSGPSKVYVTNACSDLFSEIFRLVNRSIEELNVALQINALQNCHDYH